MRELTYTLDEPSGLLRITAQMTLRTGKESYLANPMVELVEAMDAGVPFKAHAVVGMKPAPIIVNPAHVATIEAV